MLTNVVDVNLSILEDRYVVLGILNSFLTNGIHTSVVATS